MEKTNTLLTSRKHKVLFFVAFALVFFLFGAFLQHTVSVNNRNQSAAVGVPTATDAVCKALSANAVIDVRDFGAVGDGVADDTSAVKRAFQCAIAKFAELGTNTQRAAARIHFPEGRYRLTSMITFEPPKSYRFGSGVAITGEGSDKTTLVADHEETLMRVELAAKQPLIRSQVTVRDLRLVADTANNGAALTIAGNNTDALVPRVLGHVENITITRTSSTEYFKYGVVFSHLFTPTVENVVMDGERNASTREVCVDSLCMDESPLATVVVKTHSCIFSDTSYGTNVNELACDGAMRGVTINRAAEGEMVTNSTISDTNVGVLIAANHRFLPGPSASDGKIVGNSISAYRRGLQVQDKSWMIIADNTFDIESNEQRYEDIVLYGTRNSIIADNTFTSDGLNRVHVFLSGKTAGITFFNEDNTIADNIFEGAKNGIVLGPGAKNNVIRDNTFSSGVANNLWNLSGASQTLISL